MFFSVSDLKVVIGQEELFSRLSFSMNQGEKLVLSGPSGSGKTTLLNIIMGFVRPTAGHVVFMDKELDEHHIQFFRQNIAWVPQEIAAGMSVSEFIMQVFGWKHNRGKRPGKEKILEMLDSFKLKTDTYGKNMDELSGGEKQRVLLSVALLLGRKLLLLDEPVSSLDAANRGTVMEKLLGDDSLSILSVSHDTDWMANCDRRIPLF